MIVNNDSDFFSFKFWSYLVYAHVQVAMIEYIIN